MWTCCEVLFVPGAPQAINSAVGRSDPGEAGTGCTLQTTLLQQWVGPGAALRRRCEGRHSSRLADVSGRRDWEGGVLPLLGYHCCPAMRGSRLPLLLLLLLRGLLFTPSSHAHSTSVECRVWSV